MPAGDVWGNAWLSAWGSSWRQADAPPEPTPTAITAGGGKLRPRRLPRFDEDETPEQRAARIQAERERMGIVEVLKKADAAEQPGALPEIERARLQRAAERLGKALADYQAERRTLAALEAMEAATREARRARLLAVMRMVIEIV